MRRKLIVILSTVLITSAAMASPAEARPRRRAHVVRITTASQRANAQVIRDVWPDSLEDKAIRVAYCESTLNASAQRRRSQFVGLFQMGYRVHRLPQAQLRDPRYNAERALALYQRSGWRPWSCRKW